MTFDKMLEETQNNEDARGTRVSWSSEYKWVCLAQPAFKIPTENIWNKHTKEQSKSFDGEMNLSPYYIFCDKNNINYGLESLTYRDKHAIDWILI